jgi:titin
MERVDRIRIERATRFAGIVLALLVSASCQEDSPDRPQGNGAIRVHLTLPSDSTESTALSGKPLVLQIRRVDLQVHRRTGETEALLVTAGTDIGAGQTTFRIETNVPSGDNTTAEVAASGSIDDEESSPEDGVLFFGRTSEPFAVTEGGETPVTITLAPFYPRGLRATGNVQRGYRLDWTPVMDAEFYVVRRILPGGGTDDKQVETSSAVFPPDSSGTIAGRVLHRVFARNAYFSGALSDSVGVPAGSPAPPPPSGLLLLALSEDSVRVRWAYEGEAPERFRLERRRFDVPGFAVIDSVPGSQRSFTDTELEALTEYFYQVRAQLGGLASAPVGPLSITTLPPRPSGLSARDSTRSGVFLTWRYPPIEPSAFGLWRRDMTAGTDWEKIESLDGPDRSYLDGTVNRLSTYAYSVDATVSGLTSKRADPVAITVGLGIPATPSGLQAVAEGPDRIRLIWNDESSNEARFEIERRAGQGEFSVIGESEENSEELLDSDGLQPRTEYTFRVRAVSAQEVSSDPSNAATDRTWPPAPFDLTASVAGSTSIVLAWGYEEGPPDLFHAEWRICGQTSWEGATSVPGGTRTIALGDLAIRTNYEFRLSAEDSGDRSPYAVAVGATPPPLPPLDAVFDPYAPQVNLNWPLEEADPDHFDVEKRGLNEGGVWAALPQSPFGGSFRSAVDTGIQINSQYGYRMRAVDRMTCGEDTVGSGWRYVEVSTALLPPAPPTGLRATFVSQEPTGILLEWSASEGVVSGYEVERRRMQDLEYSLISTLPGNVETHIDTTVLPARTYSYRIRAVNLAGPSGYSNGAAGTTAGWRPIQVRGRSPSPRNGPAGAWIPEDRQILIFGGGGGGSDTLSDMWVFRVADSTWVEQQYSSSPPIGGRYRASMAYDPVHAIAYLDGGSPWPEDGGGWVLDRATSHWSWICLGDYGSEFWSKQGSGAVWLTGVRRFYAFGGWQYTDYPASAYLQDYRTFWQDPDASCLPVTTDPGDLPSARAGHGMASWDPNGFLLWGGRNETQAFNDFYLFSVGGAKNGALGARLRAQTPPPEPRHEADCASDYTRGLFYVLGGFNASEDPTNDLHVAQISDLSAAWTVLDQGGERNLSDPPATDALLFVDPGTGWLYHVGPGPSRLDVWLYVP